VPIVPLYLATDPPYLTSDVPLTKPPSRPPRYAFEWFDVVPPEAAARGGRDIQRELEARYRARFAEQVERRLALASPGDHDQKS
jgi:hypothetical protein